MGKSKKAIFFTLITIIFIDIFLFSYRIDINYSEADKMEMINGRVNMINDFVRSLERDAEKAQYITGFRGLVSIINYVVSEGHPVTVNEKYNEVFFNGTIEGNSSNSPLMENQTIGVWISNVETLADDLDLNLTLNIYDVTIKHKTPWILISEMKMNYTLIDNKGVAIYERNVTITSQIPIEGWPDPLYALRTNGGSRTIIKANHPIWNGSGLYEQIVNKTYTSNNEGPSLLFRIMNLTEMDPDGNGIETILDSSVFGNPINKSMVDYIYWNNSAPTNASLVPEINIKGYPNFRLDSDHCLYYNVVCP